MAKRKRKPMAEINVVPYIDVMLVLLVIFMATAPLMTQGVTIDLPKAESKPITVAENDEVLLVSYKADGSLYLNTGANENTAKERDVILITIEKVLKRTPDTPVLIKGDAELAYGHVVKLMSDLQKVGALSVGLVTDTEIKQ